MSSLLEDIAEDSLADALASPASRPIQARKQDSWGQALKPTIQWTFTGYVALLNEYICPKCGAKSLHSLGVFSEEMGSNHTRRLSRAPIFGRATKRMEIHSHPGELCESCLLSLGFDTLTEGPQVRTNVEGRGFIQPKELP